MGKDDKEVDFFIKKRAITPITESRIHIKYKPMAENISESFFI